MKCIVQKFGGSSIATVDRIKNISKIIIETYDKGLNVVVVVSAQGNTTNQLIEKMETVNKESSKREMDMLISVGEQISISLLASYINSLGYPAISLTGWQAGIYTNNIYNNARIIYIDNKRILKELNERKIVIVAGFQGIDKNNNITTLGRGGSDTSAVALAISLNASVCQIFTDVDGVYTADPRLVKDAKKIDEITFDEMLEMASLGAKVLHNRSVELAKKNNLEIDVRSSFNNKPGTKVKEEISLEKQPIRGITSDDDILLVQTEKTINNIYEMMLKLKENNIIISGISLSGIDNENKICFLTKKNQKKTIDKLFNKETLDYIDNVTKISIIGSGLMSNNILLKLFEIFLVNEIKPYLILTGEITVSLVVNKKLEEKLINILHQEYKRGC